MKTINITLYKFDELSKEAQEKAIEDKREKQYRYNDFFDWIIDDCCLLEPPHKELKQLYKKLKIEPKEILIKNNRKVYFDFYDKYINISEAMEIQDNYIFLKWLGLNDRLINKITFEIGKDTINIDLDYYKDCNLTKIEEDKIQKAVEKFEDHCKDILNSLEESYNYCFTDEFITDELINLDYDFKENGEIYN